MLFGRFLDAGNQILSVHHGEEGHSSIEGKEEWFCYGCVVSVFDGIVISIIIRMN